MDDHVDTDGVPDEDWSGQPYLVNRRPKYVGQLADAGLVSRPRARPETRQVESQHRSALREPPRRREQIPSRDDAMNQYHWRRDGRGPNREPHCDAIAADLQRRALQASGRRCGGPHALQL